MSDPNDLDSAQTQEDTVKRRVSRRLIGVIVGAITFVIATIALSFALLSGGGNQPEDVLPRDTIAIAKIDLNPKIGQRINLVRFLSKFPETIKNFNEEDPVGSLLEQSLFTSDLNWEEIKPWIGSRYAIALVEIEDELHPVLAISIKDSMEMNYYFKKNYPDLNTAVVLDYVLIANEKSVLDVITSAPTHLSDNQEYSSDMDTLGGDQIASIWINLKPITEVADTFVSEFLYNQGLDQDFDSIKGTSGRIAVGMRFTSDTFVTDLVSIDLNQSEVQVESQTKSLEVIGDLPSDLLGVLSLEGIGKAINESLQSNSLLQEALDFVGISTVDLGYLLDGSIALIAVEDNRLNYDPFYLLRIAPTNPDQSLAALQRLLNQNGFDPRDFDSIVAAEEGYIYVSSNSENLQRGIGALKSEATPLRDSEQFKKTLSESGNVMLFVDLKRLLPKLDIDTTQAPLGALGISIGGDSKQPGVSRTKITLSLNSD